MTSNREKPKVTLDYTFKAMEQWRNNKDQYETRGIPDNIWKMIFQLEDEGLSSKDLKRMFSLNSKQYGERRNQRSHDNAKSVKQANDLDPTVSVDKGSNIFCEANISPDVAPDIPSLSDTMQKNKDAVATLKSTRNRPQDYLDMTTIIVEYIRPDGHRLKIHTTNESIHKIMSAFAQQGVRVND